MSIALDNKKSNRSTVLRNGTLGMILWVLTELMFFSGLISSFMVNASDNLGAWPPKWQPRLPVYETGFNTILLLLSAVTMFMAVQKVKGQDDKSLKAITRNLLITMVFGALFVMLQGVEWVRLIEAGLTTTSSLFGAFFYIIIGAHGIHALAGVFYLIYVSSKVIKTPDWDKKSRMLTTLSIYWYFVVLLWPFLYVVVYIMPSKIV